MPLTNTDLKTKIKSNYEANSHTVPTNEVDTESGVTTPSSPVENLIIVADSDLDYLITAIADAIISEIKAEGIDIGDSLATKVDVG